MTKELNIIKNYLIYFGTLLIICIIGASNVFAINYTNIGDKSNVSVFLVSTDYSSSPFNVPKDSSYAFAEVTAIDIQIDNFNFQANTNYQLEAYLYRQQLTNANTYSVSGLNGEACLISYDSDKTHFNGEYPRWAFQCPHATTSVNIRIYNSSGNYLWSGTNVFTWSYTYLKSSTDPINSSSSNDSQNIIDNQNQNTQDIINNQNQNTQDIIDNQNQNTQDIINNQNQNTQSILEDNKKNFQTCRESKNILNLYNLIYKGGSNISPNIIDKNTINFTTNSQGYGYSFYEFDLPITDLKGKTIYLSFKSTNINSRILMRLYDSNNSSIGSNYDSEINIPSDTSASYLGIRFYPSYNVVDPGNQVTFSELMMSYEPIIEYEPYGEEICTNKLDEQTNAINGLNDSLNDDDTTGATSEASDFFNSFTTNTFGLTSIITAPLNLIQSLTSSTCIVLHLPLPYLSNKYLDLPCMSSIYQTHFGAFFTMYQTITYGIIAYWVCVRIFNQVKDFKNPEHDEIEVVDL